MVQLFEKNTYSVVNVFDVTLRPQLNVTGVVEVCGCYFVFYIFAFLEVDLSTSFHFPFLFFNHMYNLPSNKVLQCL